MPKKFYRTTYRVVVLSEEQPLTTTALEDVNYEITYGHCSGVVEITEAEELTAAEAARELEAQGSDPEFFGLDAEGNEVEE